MSSAPHRSKQSGPSHGKPEVRWVDETESIVKSTNQPKHTSQSTSAPFILETGRTRPAAAQSRQLIHSYASRHRPQKGKGRVKKPNADAGRGKELTWKVDVQEEPKSKALVKVKVLSPTRPVKQNVMPPLSIRLDPFHTLRVPSNQETDLVLHHWIWVVERAGRETLSPEFWSFVAASPALLFATMSISALDIHNTELKTFKQPSYSFLRYKYEALKEVNKNMQKTSEQLRDSTVCAVAVLALSDLVLDMHPAFEKHIEGLSVIIEQRGGFHTLQGITRQIVMWAVSITVSFNQKPPRFYIASNVTTSEELSVIETSGSYIRKYLSDVLPRALEADLVAVYGKLSALTYLLDQPESLVPGTKEGSFAEKCVQLETQFLALIARLEKMKDFKGRDLLLAFVLAAMIYQYAILRYFNRTPGAVREQFTIRTRTVLKRLDLPASVTTHSDLMIWVLTLAAIEQDLVMSPDDDYSAWLQAGRNLCRQLQLQGIEDVESALRRFAWPRKATAGDDYTAYWKEVLRMD